MRTADRFLRFGCIGGLGFLVDGGLLTLLTAVGGMDVVVARCFSFSCASTVTWFCNRHLTFGDRRSARRLAEWLRYISLNSVGAVLNLGIFLALIAIYPVLGNYPLIPLAIAAAVVVVVNFLLAKEVAFGARDREVRNG